MAYFSFYFMKVSILSLVFTYPSHIQGEATLEAQRLQRADQQHKTNCCRNAAGSAASVEGKEWSMFWVKILL